MNPMSWPSPPTPLPSMGEGSQCVHAPRFSLPISGAGKFKADAPPSPRLFWERGVGGVRAFLLLSLLILLAGCNNEDAKSNNPPQTSTSSAGGFPRTVTDGRGKSVVIPAAPQRIVSLAPSNTEILFALGLDSRIAGVTSQCDFPPDAKKKPNVGGYPISAEKVLVLNPDLVVTVGAINTKETEALEQAHIPVVSVNPKSLTDVFDAIKLIGQATGQDTQSDVITETMKAEIEVTENALSKSNHRPKTLIIHGVSPLYTTNPDSYIAEVITSAGADYLVKTNLPGSVISPEALLLNPPDVIVCSPELVQPVSALPGFTQGIPAVRNHRFYTDAALIDRPGPRLPQAIDHLARYLHPECFPPAKSPATPAAKPQ